MKVAIIQLAANDEVTKLQRIERAETLLDSIYTSDKRPQLVMLPEIWGSGFFSFDRYKAESELLTGETYQRLRPWAIRLKCYLLTGSFVERKEDNFYNTTLLVSPLGEIAAVYRKLHLFGYQSKEQKILTPGESAVTIQTEFGVWGLTTCYDLRFPELYRQMVDQGAEIFLVVSAWPLARLEHWTLFNRVRALENQAYLISCNSAGTNGGQAFAGHSMIVDPWGVPRLTGGEGEEILWGEIDRAKIKENRRMFPALKDRRIGQLYSIENKDEGGEYD